MKPNVTFKNTVKKAGGIASGFALFRIQFLHHMGILAEAVFLLGLADGAVLNGLCGAIADAGHAVGAILAPDGLAVL